METESQRQEREIANRLARIHSVTRAQPGSGNQATSPNDVVVRNHFHIECKTTEAAQMVVPYSWIGKAQALAKQFCVPAFMAFRFSKFSQHDYFLLEDTHFYNYVETEKQNEALIHENKQLRAKLGELKDEIHALRVQMPASKANNAYPSVDPYAAVRKKL
jgi:Holliday junction resolvase